MNKRFITAQELLEDSFRLAAKVFEDGFRPQFIVGIWRGGAPIGIAVQEYFDFKKIETDHIETPSPLNPLGIKGAGEAGAIPTGALFAQAVEDALIDLNIEICEIPLSPNRLYEIVYPKSD